MQQSRFFYGGDSESSTASSDEEDVAPVRPSGPLQRGAIYLSDEEEDVKRVVRSQKDKRYDELAETARAIKNSRKINDVAKVTQGFENLGRAYQKAKGVISQENTRPVIFIKTLVELEDFVQEMWEGRKKLSKNNSKALLTLKQKLRKYNKDFEEDIANYRAVCNL
jgi:translation initiation factor 3 subunit C